ncbi:Blp family class II bacteriocin [Streptococcus mutans]|uniref:Blp family class II bacteriocin n=1 Tax=Streptococcus mutans TaxID=1309 RepID=UPI0038BD4402
MDTHVLEQFDVMDSQVPSAIEGGGCSWKGADKAGFSGGVGGLIGAGGNPVGGVLGIVGGLDAYGELVGGN